MSQPISPLEQTFLDLAAIDEMNPHEDKVLGYIMSRLDKAGVSYHQDEARNIVARIPGAAGEPLALVGHTDIAAPLAGRQIVVTDERIKTDGTGLLGGDDKTSVAAMLELADSLQGAPARRPLELLFTIGEESGGIGVVNMDTTALKARQALVFDWMGGVNRVITESPAYVKVDVQYIGVNAHPAHWRDGKNAGMALIAAAGQLQVGDYSPGVSCNIGIFGFGKARNQVPGYASLQAELRSHDASALKSAIAEIRGLFERVAAEHHIEAKLDFNQDSAAYTLDQAGPLYAEVTAALSQVDLQPVLEATFGGFDANVLAARGIETVILGAAFHDPHSPSEYVDRAEFAQLYDFLKMLVTSKA